MTVTVIQPLLARNQREQILAHLKTGRPLTPLEALRRYGCMRLAARVEELRDAGEPIITERVVDGVRSFASYRRVPNLPPPQRTRERLLRGGRR
jgi:hypothetical protein